MLFTTSACTLLPLLIMYENRIKGLKANSISERVREKWKEKFCFNHAWCLWPVHRETLTMAINLISYLFAVVIINSEETMKRLHFGWIEASILRLGFSGPAIPEILIMFKRRSLHYS